MAKVDAGKTTGKLPQFKPFNKLDGNKDNVLTGTEIKKNIAGFDADKDGKITKEEYDAGVKAAVDKAKEDAKAAADKAKEEAKAAAEKAKQERLEKAFKKHDINNDGKLSGSEVGKLGKYDIDKDGKVSLPEFKYGKELDAHNDKVAGAEKRFDKVDGNKDGYLSGTEAEKYKDRDADQDGKITKDEFLKPIKDKAPTAPTSDGAGSGDPTTGTAPTEPPKTEGKFKTFKQRDINNDGVLSGSETKGLSNYDGDGSGEISKDEFLAARKKENANTREAKREKQYGKIDGNKDGYLSGTETKGIEHYDADKDGKVSTEEYNAGKKADWKAKIDKKAEDLFAKADGNKDGALTGTEAKKHEAYDADKDGTVTEDEFKAGLAADRKKRHEEAILGK
ncbi:MAG: hypothetical protein FJZ01_23060 [Candidatus Sericytochromatia bacterium]|nr:hypothetical protein [Candidatus Tanganyikabacteria bacterium]